MFTDSKNLFTALIMFNIFLGAVVYIQFAAFSAIVDDIVNIRQDVGYIEQLAIPLLVLGLSFLAPSILNSISVFCKSKFKMQQTNFLDLCRVEKQGSLDIGTLESNTYQNLLRSAHEWGSKSVINIQEFVLSAVGSFAGIITSMIILWTLNHWLIVLAIVAAAPVYFLYKNTVWKYST